MSSSNPKTSCKNETACATLPGRSDQKPDTTSKGATLITYKRFSDHSRASSSLDSLIKSTPSQTTFATPQLRKIRLTSRERYENIRSYWSSASSESISSCKSDVKSVPKKEITRTDYNRLENKLTVLELKLTEQKLENNQLKEELKKTKLHETELKIQLEKTKHLAQPRTKEVLEIKNSLEILTEKLNQERQDNKTFIDMLNEEKLALKTKNEDLEEILAENQNVIVAFNEKYLNLVREHESLQEQNQNCCMCNKQKHNIDELNSNLVLEQERYVTEKNEIVDKLCSVVRSNEVNCKQVQELLSKLETMNRSLNNENEKITLIEDAKSIVENQFVESKNMILTFQSEISKSKEHTEAEIKEVQPMISLFEDKFEAEIYKLENNNTNEAEHILQISMAIDNLQKTLTKYKTFINCLEAEKSNLNLQLEDKSSKISALETALDRKIILINSLQNQLNTTEIKYEECLVQIDNLHETVKKHNEELKLNTNISIELSDAEEKIVELQEKLSQKEKEFENQRPSCNLIEENKRLYEELEETKLRLQITTQEKDKIDHELIELMGHQNIHQKIKHVNQLKQTISELHQKILDLEIENGTLRKKLGEFKENVPQPDNTSKSDKRKAARDNLTPGVLRDRKNK